MIYLYDKSFEGLLTAVFDCYSNKIIPQDIVPAADHQASFFAETTEIVTDQSKSDRIWKGLQKYMSEKASRLPYLAYLSGEPGIELSLFYFMKLTFDRRQTVEDHFSDEHVLKVRKAANKVMKESHRLIEFIRFQRTLDDIYFSPIGPDYDILPFILHHFKDRFADQRWLIYDVKRDYGFYYDLRNLREVKLNEKQFDPLNGEVPDNLLHEGEGMYQSAWKGYIKHIAIKERMNLKLQRLHMPRRYWKFMTEMGS